MSMPSAFRAQGWTVRVNSGLRYLASRAPAQEPGAASQCSNQWMW